MTLRRGTEEPCRVRERWHSKWDSSQSQRQNERIVPDAETPRPGDGGAGSAGAQAQGQRAMREFPSRQVIVVIELSQPVVSSSRFGNCESVSLFCFDDGR